MRFQAVALGVLMLTTSVGAQLPVAPAGRVLPIHEPGTLAELAEAMREFAAAAPSAFADFQRVAPSCKSAEELVALSTRSATELADRRRPAVAQVLAGVRPIAATPAAVQALAWVAASRAAGLSAEAAGLLKAHHLAHRETVSLAYGSREDPTLWSEALLKALRASADVPEDLRPGILEALAVTKQNQAEAAKALRAMSPSQVKMWLVGHGPELLASYRGLDIKATEAEAVSLFGQFGESNPLAQYRRSLTYADFAKSSAFEIRNLQVGQVAPDFTGEDFDGAKYRLSESRGKVVAVVFYGELGGEPSKTVAHLETLAADMKGLPFQLVAVHSGRDRAKVADALAGAGATWRNLWCGAEKSSTDIASAWNVHRDATIYFLDAGGVIRVKGLPFGQSLHYEVKALLAEHAAKK